MLLINVRQYDSHKKAMNCYICEEELTDLNRSPEHILPEALGNNIVSWGLLCQKCNNTTASQIDADFVQFTGHLFRLVLQAKPNARVDDSITGFLSSGEAIRFGPNMQMETVVEIPIPDGPSIIFTAPPEKAEKRAKRILNQLKRKYPKMEPEKMLAKATRGTRPLEELVYLANSNYNNSTNQSEVGGPAFFRGIKKTAVNFYLSRGFDQAYIQGIINQVKAGVPAPQVISTFYYPTLRPVHELGEFEISHVIKLVGDPEKEVLYCYVELFNTSRSLILLNNHYTGPAISEQYCYDVLTSKHLEKTIVLPFGHREHVLNQFEFSRDTNAQGQAAYDRTHKILTDALRKKGLII